MRRRTTIQLTAILLMTSYSVSAFAGTYKCYVQASDGKKHVMFAQTQSLDSAQSMVLGATPPSSKKKTPTRVTSIIECKSADESFNRGEARIMESAMPM